jgi:hypothetical protein
MTSAVSFWSWVGDVTCFLLSLLGTAGQPAGLT